MGVVHPNIHTESGLNASWWHSNRLFFASSDIACLRTTTLKSPKAGKLCETRGSRRKRRTSGIGPLRKANSWHTRGFFLLDRIWKPTAYTLHTEQNINRDRSDVMERERDEKREGEREREREREGERERGRQRERERERERERSQREIHI